MMIILNQSSLVVQSKTALLLQTSDSWLTVYCGSALYEAGDASLSNLPVFFHLPKSCLNLKTSKLLKISGI